MFLIKRPVAEKLVMGRGWGGQSVCMSCACAMDAGTRVASPDLRIPGVRLRIFRISPGGGFVRGFRHFLGPPGPVWPHFLHAFHAVGPATTEPKPKLYTYGPT